MRLPRLKIHKSLVLIVSLLLFGLTLAGVSKGSEYLAVKGLRTEAKSLVEKGNYQDAIKKLQETNEKWATQSVKEGVQKEIAEYEKLAESAKNFEEGREKYYAEDYKEAIELLKKVLRADVNYKNVQEWLVLAEKKLAEGEKKETPKGSVAGVKTQAVAPANTSQSSFITPVPSPKPDDDPISDSNQSTQMPLSSPNQIFQFYNPFSNQPPSQNQPTYSPQPLPTYEITNKPSSEYCNSQLAYLESKYQSDVSTENRNYQRRLNEINESFASRGLYGSGIHKTEQGLLAIEHNENLDSLKREYERNLASLKNAGCNF